MTAYYNEFDPYAAQWLRNLIAAGLIPAGDVDDRSITEVKADEIKGYTQCHFFAGIGGWSLALKLANWPDDRPVWTGSCPCQPFAACGDEEGQDDPRHLWPTWKNLIAQRKPATIFGEQVANAVTHGWLDEVAVDLENAEYAIAATILPACAAGAFHRRDRLWFVAHPLSAERRPPAEGRRDDADRDDAGWQKEAGRFELHGQICTMADATRERGDRRADTARPPGRPGIENPGSLDWVACPDGKDRPVKPGIRLLADGVPARVVKLRAFGNAIVPQVAAEFISAYMEC